MINKQSGFTLLEVLLAVSITAMIGIGASQLLSSTIETKNATEIRAAQLKDLQRVDLWVKRDFIQTAGRVTLDANGIDKPAVYTDGDFLIEFSHSGLAPLRSYGNTNTDKHAKRSNIQRVAYAVRSKRSDYCKDALLLTDNEEGNCFIRILWPVLDFTSDTEPTIQLLLEDVETVRFFYKGQLLDLANPSNTVVVNQWQEEWPGPYLTGSMVADLVQVKIEITTKQLGQVERIYEVPRYAFFDQ